MAEIRINTTGGLKLYDADNSHYAQIVAGTITSNVDAITLGHNLATFNAAVTATGILKTDDTTEATSTTDGSLQTDGGLSVAKDAIIGDDLKLLSDSAVLSLGAGSDITFTHDGTTGLTIAATPISIDSTGELHLNSTTGDIKLQDGGTDQIAFDLDGTSGEVIMKPAVDSDDLVISQYDGTEVIRIEDNASLGLVGNKLSIANSSSDVVIKPLTDAKDIIFQQYDGTVVATVEDNATFNIPASKLAIGGTAVTATAAELNLLDGGTSVGSSITLADADGFVVNDGGTMKTIPATDLATYIGGGITEADSWRQHSNTAVNGTLDPISSNWERSDHSGAGYLGTGMSQSSGVFTFPSTGYWLVTFKVSSYGNGGAVTEIYSQIRYTGDNSSYVSIAHGVDSNYTGNAYGMSLCSTILDITDTSNHKVRFKIYTNASSLIQGNTGEDATSVTFVRLGDT